MEELEKDWNDGALKLFPFQVTGIETMRKWLNEGHGGINADEMGLGKTCQAIVFLTRQFSEGKGPFLVVSPLTVCDHWEQEIRRFSGGLLSPLKFTGFEADRMKVYDDTTVSRNTVFITAPHILIFRSTLPRIMKQQSVLPFSTITIDEAQCIKNQNTILARTLRKISDANSDTTYLLLTGTPIQNNLSELYSLLNFADMKSFPAEKENAFITKYSDQNEIEELKQLLKVYMIRRTKDEVFSKIIEKCDQVLLYHGVSSTQRELYKSIITKNKDFFKGDMSRVQLQNILMQLRKCAIHPYMFRGIEPEPFKEGEHIVEVSGKLQVLDRLLKYITEKGHRCLLFSQFLGSLDIVEDLLRMRGWPYERLDGTCRVEARRESINSFQKHNSGGPVCFLLTTKAGGVGLNLVAADTVIFLDSDWNPQSDIQAMARCHRIGQTKTVRVIRLVARYTVDQYVVAKARDKLKLTDRIMENEDSALTAADFIKMLRDNFGLLMEADTKAFNCSDAELENIIGSTKEKGRWEPLDKNKKEFHLNPDECDKQDVDKTNYCKYEGVSYRDCQQTSEKWWKEIVTETQNDENKENRRKRRHLGAYELSSSPQPSQSLPTKSKKTKKDTWAAKGYASRNLPDAVAKEEVEDEHEDKPLKYVLGDVTHPEKYGSGKDLILHGVDNGGVFGTGGLFTAMKNLDGSIEKSYELAGKMKDLHMGDAHLCEIVLDDRASTSSSIPRQLAVALLVAQSNKNRRIMKPEYLEMCLRRVSQFAKQEGYTIHTPRFGKGCDISWYMIDRLFKKHFSLRGVPCFVYYHQPARRPPVEEEDEQVEEHNQERKIKSEQNEDCEEQTNETPSRRLRRRPILEKKHEVKREEDDRMEQDEENYNQESASSIKKTKKEEDEDSSEESSDESSASENNWSDQSVTSSEGEMEIEEDEEENASDEGVEDSPVKRKPQNVNKPRPKQPEKRRFQSMFMDSDDGEDAPPTSFIKPQYYVTDNTQVVAIFHDEVVSLLGLDEDDQADLRQLVENYGGEVVTEEVDLDKVTLAAVPEVLIKEGGDQLEDFKQRFNKDCLFIRQQFLPYAADLESLEDVSLFIV